MSTPSSPALASLTLQLEDSLPPERWHEVESEARERARIVDAVASARASGLSHRKALALVAPEVNWSTYLHWWRHARDRVGAPWERQLDARLPPEPNRIAEEVLAAACLLRRMDPTVSSERAQELLMAQFGTERGEVSATVLKRTWREAGLAQPRGGFRGGPREEVTDLNGGGGLALLAAACQETGIAAKLGMAVSAQAQLAASIQGEVPPNEVDVYRDNSGCFTGAYNRAVHGDHDRDPRLACDADKRTHRDLTKLHLLRDSAASTGRKLLAIGVSPLITERRGFDGLEGPAGDWLAALGGPAYADTTLDRCLAELALANVGESLWSAHADNWQRVTARWCDDADEWWRQSVIYVDATQDPYWTRQFAASGKVSRVGRVMPCLTRVAVMGGPGVPLVVDTHAGGASLKNELLPMLDRLDDLLGKGELGRLTVVDAEAASTKLLTALSQRPEQWFITVLKGGIARAAEVSEAQPWCRYREHDLIRGVAVRLDGKGAPEGGLTLRGVEMVRDGSRNPVTTLFVTDADADDLPIEQIPTAYLSRWPHQEQRFREARNGLGLDRSHGYGGTTVTHVALSTKLEQAERSLERAEAKVERAREVEQTARSAHADAPRGERTQARAVLTTARSARKTTERNLASAQRARDKLNTLPREIYVRDTTRDGIATCLKLTVFMLIEYVLKEYFGGLRMEPRTFIELFVATPVTIRERTNEICYELQANPRSPKNTEHLVRACEEITRREIRLGDRTLRFVVVDPDDGSTRRIERP